MADLKAWFWWWWWQIAYPTAAYSICDHSSRMFECDAHLEHTIEPSWKEGLPSSDGKFCPITWAKVHEERKFFASFLLKKAHWWIHFEKNIRYACSPQKSFEILRELNVGILERVHKRSGFLMREDDVTPVDLAGGHCYRSSIKTCKSTVPLGTVAYGWVTRSQSAVG